MITKCYLFDYELSF